jgi:hypothetical protein
LWAIFIKGELLMTQKTIAIWAALLLAVWFVGPRLLGFRSWGWHQKLVLEVNTPHGVVSGGSTIAAGVSIDPKWIPITAGGGHSWIRGESSFVEVSPGKYLFAVLRDQGETDRAVHAFHSQIGAINGTTAQIFDALETKRGTGVVARAYYPDLVTFDDLSDPRSVTVVDPDNLEKTFGPGVSLSRITLEITNDRVSDGPIERILKWLPDYYAIEFGRGRAKFGSPEFMMINSLASGAFKVR